VRPRRASDAGACLAMARQSRMADGYPPRGPIDLATFLSPPQQLAAWVADADGAVVGHVSLHRTGAAVTVAAAARYLGVAPGDVAVVARLMVGPGARRSGAGRRLLDTAAAEARRRGLHPVLDVATELEAAVALYERAGWERAGEVTIRLKTEPDLDCYVYVAPRSDPHQF